PSWGGARPGWSGPRHGHRHHHRHRRGIYPGIIGGAIIGSTLAAPYFYDPYYYDDVVVAPGGPSAEEVAYCSRRFKSYDPRTGTYLGYDGLRHPCP
ncbi:MAG: BA14K family protein, partial [Xanthobacteraceae bacterium]